MFDKEFYPTPKEVIQKMIAPYEKNMSRLTILEPSAGKGDIIDYISRGTSFYKANKDKIDRKSVV